MTLRDNLQQLMKASNSMLRPIIRDFAAEFLWRAGLTSPLHRGQKHLSIVTFHRVLTDAQLAQYPIPEIAVTCDEFSWFIKYFQQHFDCGPLLQSLDRFVSGEPVSRPLMAITFDDGQLDNFNNALPILHENGLTSTFYVTESGTETGCALWHDEAAFAMRGLLRSTPRKAKSMLAELGLEKVDIENVPKMCAQKLKSRNADDRCAFIARIQDALGDDGRPNWDGMMDAVKLRQLVTSGHEIGSHTASHAILVQCNPSELKKEVSGSREYLEAITGKSIDSFCYPNGDHSRDVVNAVKRAGYRAAVTTTWGRNDSGTNALKLRRCDIQGATARSRRGRLSPARMGLRLSGLQKGL